MHIQTAAFAPLSWVFYANSELFRIFAFFGFCVASNIEYSGAENEFELILQSWSGGANWARVQPSETGRANDRYYAKFTYADCVKELGAGFDKLDQLHAAAKNGDITVYSICYCTPAK